MTHEIAVTIECQDSELLGVIHSGADDAELGIIFVVGGPQYRVGSHRMFVELARKLAERGNLVLRFDCRGMGDSDGTFRSFEGISDDIRCAIDVLGNRTSARKFVLVGLCDGASASLMYVPEDSRVVALVLMNPSVHSATNEAKARVEHYYRKRLLQLDFWLRILRDGGRLIRSITSLSKDLMLAMSRKPAEQPGYVDRMLFAWRAFSGKALVLLSSDDLTSQEFSGLISSSQDWSEVAQRPIVSIVNLEGVDHTFSGEGQLETVQLHIEDFIRSCG